MSFGWGTQKEINTLDELGSTKSRITTRSVAHPDQVVIQYVIRAKVRNNQQETEEYLKWSDDLRSKKQTGKLICTPKKPLLQPYFAVEYPENNIDGTYFVIKSWSEKS